MKKWRISLIISVLLALCLCIGSAFSQEGKNLIFGFENSENRRDWKNHKFFAEMEKLFDVSFDYMQLSDERELSNFKNALIEGKIDKNVEKNSKNSENDIKIPDVFFKAHLSRLEQKRLYEKGAIINLYPLLEKNAPNFYALIKSNEELRKAVEIDENVIVALPYIDLLPNINAMWINRLWLEVLHLNAPKNADELFDVLMAFKEKDPNQNGKKDEKPLNFTGVYDLKHLAHAFSIVCDDFNFSYENQKPMHFSESEGFSDFLEFVARLGREKLIELEAMSVPESIRRENEAKAAKRYGFIIAPLPSHYVPNEWIEDFICLLPFENEGKRAYRQITSPIHDGCFAIGSGAKQAEKLLKWVDYLYSDEGARLARLGVLGEDYAINGDGTWRLNEANRLTRAGIEGAFDTPGISLGKIQYDYHDAKVGYCLRELDLVRPFIKSMPTFECFDIEKIERVRELNQKLSKLLDDFIGRIALNQIELSDISLADFRQSLLDNGLEELRELIKNGVGGK